MKRQVVTIEVTVPDDAENPDLVIGSILDDTFPQERGYSYWMTRSSEVWPETKLAGPIGWHWVKIRMGGHPVQTATQMREVLTAVGRPDKSCVEAGDDDGQEWWVLELATDDPLIGTTTRVRLGDGEWGEVEIPIP